MNSILVSPFLSSSIVYYLHLPNRYSNRESNLTTSLLLIIFTLCFLLTFDLGRIFPLKQFWLLASICKTNLTSSFLLTFDLLLFLPPLSCWPLTCGYSYLLFTVLHVLHPHIVGTLQSHVILLLHPLHPLPHPHVGRIQTTANVTTIYNTGQSILSYC